MNDTMKIFLDTADTQAIADGYDTGLIDGITTNPTLIMKSGRDPEEVYQELIDLGIPDISMEVVGSKEQMLWEGQHWRNQHLSILIYSRYPLYILLVKILILYLSCKSSS